jgi:hypothetical protein
MLAGAWMGAYAEGCGARSGLELSMYIDGGKTGGSDGGAGSGSGTASGSGSGTSPPHDAGSGSSMGSSSGSGSGTSPGSASGSGSGSSVPLDAGGGSDAGDGGCDASDPSAPCACPVSDPLSGECVVNGLVCAYPSASCLCTNGCSPGSCCPISCAQAGFPCGPIGDGCGAVLDQCRVCPPGEACGASNACEATIDAGCVPKACPPSACGLVDDGCGGQINCGGCYWECGTDGGDGGHP